MPLYLAYCPDYPESLERRLKVREAHLKKAGQDKVEGRSLFGRAFLSATPEGADAYPADPSAPNPRMAGSVMHFYMPSLEACWARVKEDPYWEGGVWDKEKTTVMELLPAPGDKQ